VNAEELDAVFRLMTKADEVKAKKDAAEATLAGVRASHAQGGRPAKYTDEEIAN
jgi:hypothetical protein